MIPGVHRTKGGAAMLGAAVHGQPGPFGSWSVEADDSEALSEAPDDNAGTSAWAGHRGDDAQRC